MAAEAPCTLSGGARRAGVGVMVGPICLCGRGDPGRSHLAVPCADGTGGCNGWVHPACAAVPARYGRHQTASAPHPER